MLVAAYRTAESEDAEDWHNTSKPSPTSADGKETKHDARWSAHMLTRVASSLPPPLQRLLSSANCTSIYLAPFDLEAVTSLLCATLGSVSPNCACFIATLVSQLRSSKHRRATVVSAAASEDEWQSVCLGTALACLPKC